MVEIISESPSIVEISVTDIEMDRLDPQYYSPNIVELIDQLKKENYKLLKKIIIYIRNGSECRSYVSEGNPYIKVGQQKRFFIDNVKASKISLLDSKSISNNKKINKNTLLIARSGEPGVATNPQRFNFGYDVSSHSILIDIPQKMKYYISFFTLQ